ncbi:hypothetical protein C1645_364593 [Glomus cerebriforme]|uniref:Protein kinase domain-containing protein n=1 Tax=Glomus cerebriforme TaxID=658196 RepID=A0A397SLZ8_9GLOM|nr:hypothetical protein C1645_364593 [Glomus cerebriforme]
MIMNDKNQIMHVTTSIQNNEKEIITNKYEEMITNDKFLKNQIIPETNTIKSIQSNEKEITNNYEEMIMNDKNFKNPTTNSNEKKIIINKYEEMIKHDKNSIKRNVPKTDPIKSRKIITNKYEEMIMNDKNFKNTTTNSNEKKIIINKYEEMIKHDKNSIKRINSNKKIINKYEEMIKNDNKKLINHSSIIPPINSRIMYGTCFKCYKVLEAEDWCKDCELKKFELKNWTSGDSKVDQLIRESQINAADGLDYFEWIDYREIESIEYITKGAFGRIFKGIWIKGPKHKVDISNRNWKNIPNITVALKEINVEKSKFNKFDLFLKEVNFNFICHSF